MAELVVELEVGLRYRLHFGNRPLFSVCNIGTLLRARTAQLDIDGLNRKDR